MRLLRFLGIGAVLLAAAEGGPSQGTPSSSSAGEAVRARPEFVFKAEVPTISVAGQPDGTSQVVIPGFKGRERRSGAPDLASTTYRVAIPPGVTPRLEFRVLAEEFLPRTRPRSVPRIEFDVAPDPSEIAEAPGASDGRRRDVGRRERFEEDAAIYEGTTPWPESVVSLGAIGAFRDQRYVDVHVAPARFDPVAGGLRVARSIEIRVRFEGDSGARTEPRSDARLESVYRNMFVNYAEGTTFRLDGLGAIASDAGWPEAPLAPSYVGPVYKIKIRQNKIVRLDHTRMSATPFATEPLSTWKLSNRGVEVPLDVRDVNLNNLIDPGDWVQFWGQALDDEPKAVLNFDINGTDEDIFEARDFTDENVYLLSIESGTRSRLPSRNVAPTNVRVPPNDFEAIARAETDDAFRPLGVNDPWYWLPTLLSNTSPITRTDAVPLPGLASTTSSIRVISVVRGSSESSTLAPDHHTRVTLLNGSLQVLAQNDDDNTFDGREIYTHDFTWPGAPGAATGTPQVRLEARPISVGSHQVILDRIEVRYRRLFQASNDALVFDWPDGDAEFIVSSLTSSAPEAWELTGRVGTSGVVSAVRLTGGAVSGAGTFSVRFKMDNDATLPDGTLRRFVVFGGSGGVAIPSGGDFAADVESDLKSLANQADLIVIAHPTVLGGTCQPVLSQLLAWRLANQGITAKTALVGDIYDEFNDGLPGPVAIRKFLQWVMSTNPGEGWASPKPAYVLILGDGSFDYKAGGANGSFVPTQIMFKDDPSFGYYASESIMAAVVGTDTMPDLTIGRIPVRSDGECNVALQKILGYQQAPPSGNWQRHALVISDRGKDFNVLEAAQWEATNDAALAWMKIPPHTSLHLRYWTDYCGGVASGCTFPVSNQMRADIKAAVNGTDGVSDGAAIMQFVGHGNFDLWSDDAFFDNRSPAFDTDDLLNGGRLPILFVHNCLSGGFMTTAARTLGKDFVKKSGGGSVALFAPSGLSNGYFGQDASDDIWKAFFDKRKERDLAAPVMDVYADLCGFGAIEPCQNYVLLGDPATRSALQAVAPPTAVVAAPANVRVDLSWTASTTAGARYDVYRAVDAPTNPYVKVNPALIVGTSYADLTVINAKTYYYAVVAVDTEGFESRWSHLNSDCAVDGPDCLDARPLNPNAPAAPGGVVVVDPENGGRLLVSWNASPESDLKRYDVRYGTQSGVYPNVSSAATFTSTVLSGLTNGQTYYIVVTATNTSDLTSLPSTEIAAVPTFVRGLRSPQVVAGLTIARSGTNAILSWPAVTTDIYGKATTISLYEIFRGTTTTFVPGPGNKIGETATTSFPDNGALSFANPNYHYLVRAVDTNGNRGGLGGQLPNGIGLLQVARSATPGNIVLSWAPVATDFDGHARAIDHYEVFGRSTPFSAENVRDGVIPMLASIPGTSHELTPPVGAQYYSVIVVDPRGNKSPF